MDWLHTKYGYGVVCMTLVFLLGSSGGKAATVDTFNAPHWFGQFGTPPGAQFVEVGGARKYALQLASPALGQQNSLAFGRTDPGAACGLLIQFDFRMTPGQGRADGLGVAVLNTAVYGPVGAVVPGVAEEPGFPGSLGVGFDIYQNGGELNNNHVSVHFNNVKLADLDAGAVDLASGAWIRARIALTNGTPAVVGVTLTPEGGAPVPLSPNVSVPDFIPYEGRVYFAARTGGEAAMHLIDNVDVRRTACPAAQVGRWDRTIIPLETIPIHAHLLPTGNVLFWDRHDTGGPDNGHPRLWDPITNEVTMAADPGYDVFCSGHSMLADGRLFVTGGHIFDGAGRREANIYNPLNNTWTPRQLMNAGRWYPTNVTLGNGNVLVVSGSYADTAGNILPNLLPQVFQVGTNTWRDLPGAQRQLPLYPFMHLAPNGKVFNAGPEQQARYLDLVGTGTWSDVDLGCEPYRDYGSSVMYRPGRVLVAGGSSGNIEVNPPTASVQVINLNAAPADWRCIAPMAYRRRQFNLTLLPDGSVLATGGSSAAGFNNTAGAVLAAELWNPVTEQWTTLEGQQVPRLYHSVALLLPDGRVVSAGGGHPGDVANHPDAEFYSPAYLFRGPRPTITAAPTQINYGQAFVVSTPQAAQITAANLVRLSSVTHGFNQDQRFVPLTYTTTATGLTITAPAHGNLAPPGYYMLFLLNNAAVPSEGQIIRLR